MTRSTYGWWRSNSVDSSIERAYRPKGSKSGEAQNRRSGIYTAAWTGLRWGELVGLKRECLDLDKGTVEVREALVDIGGTLSLSPPKTPASRRIVRLTDDNVAVLKRHVATYPPGQQTLVFTTEQGRPIRDDNWRKRVWKPLVASVPTVRTAPGSTISDTLMWRCASRRA